MKLRTQLYIDTSIQDEDTNYELVDFFDFESIEITETIKNIQEVDIVFTDYTKEFVIPASKNNNKIFSHYYNTKLTNSFDARIKKKARIFVNGIFFKEGYIRLTSAQVKDGYPYSYSVSFFGALSGIGDIIGETKLSDLLELKKYDHEFNLTNVASGLRKGLEYDGTNMVEYSNGSRDIVYPLISASNKWYYDSSGLGDVDNSNAVETEYKEGVSVNIHNANGSGFSDSTYGIDYKNLKPAIKVSNVFDAIESSFTSINFKKDSFIYNSKLKDLYLLLHSKKGELTQGVGAYEKALSRYLVVRARSGSSNFDLTPSNPSLAELLPIRTYTRFEGFQQARNKTQITFEVNVTTPTTGDIEYNLTILDGSTILASKTSTAFTDTISATLETTDEKIWDNLQIKISSTGSVVEYTVGMTLLESYSVRHWGDSLNDDDTGYSTNTKTDSYSTKIATYSFPQTIDVANQIPDMKVIDFMTGIFKMFNLVARVDDTTGKIEVLPLTDFYQSGVERDITNYVDTYNYDIERLQLYGEYNFTYEDASTFGLISHNEVNSDDYGNLKYPDDENVGNDSLVFDNAKYDVELPFEKLYYSRLSDENGGLLTNICEGWLVDKDESATVTKPILFFNINTDVDTATYKFGLRGLSSFISTYNRASNTSADSTISLNFGTEIDEYTLTENTNGLFKKWYRDYIVNTFDKESRRLSIEAKFPLSFLYEYSLEDRLLFNGSPFIINEITTNLNTGKSQLDLVTAYNVQEVTVPDTTPPADVTGLNLLGASYNNLNITWNHNTETDLSGYKVYVDGVLYIVLGYVNSLIITDLEPSTTYEIEVIAFDNAGNESFPTSADFSTTAQGDLEPPIVPQNLRTTLISFNAFSIEWDASTDDVAVDDYVVYLDNVAQTPSTSSTNYTVSGLTANTTYRVKVLARDTSGNESRQSSPLSVTTLNFS